MVRQEIDDKSTSSLMTVFYPGLVASLVGKQLTNYTTRSNQLANIGCQMDLLELSNSVINCYCQELVSHPSLSSIVDDPSIGQNNGLHVQTGGWATEGSTG